MDLKQRLSDTLESELATIYTELGVTTGDITPAQSLEWERLTAELSALFETLIDQNK